MLGKFKVSIFGIHISSINLILKLPAKYFTSRLCNKIYQNLKWLNCEDNVDDNHIKYKVLWPLKWLQTSIKARIRMNQIIIFIYLFDIYIDDTSRLADIKSKEFPF